MKLRNCLFPFIAFAMLFSFDAASGKTQVVSSSKSIKPTITAKVTSNRFNIYEGDTEEIPLTPQAITDVLIGMVGDSSGTVFVEVNNCESGQVYRLSKQINRLKSAGNLQEVYQTDCQVGLAYLYYDLKLEDLAQAGTSVDFYLSTDSESAKGSLPVKLGTVNPRAEISEWESYLFIDEMFSYAPQSVSQRHLGADNVFLTLVTAFSGVFIGQPVDFEISHLKSGQLKKQSQQFILESSEHEIDFSRSFNNLDMGDLIELKYRVAGYEKTYRFLVQRNYKQQVRIENARVVYDLVLDNVDWYQNENLECLNFDCKFSRGGKEIEISHALISPVGNYYLGNYQLHFSLDGYKHLYLNTSLVSK